MIDLSYHLILIVPRHTMNLFPSDDANTDDQCKCTIRARLYWGESENESGIASRWVQRESNLMFELSSNKDHNKKAFQ